MTNYDVAAKFALRQKGKSNSLKSTGDELLSYSTVIGTWGPDGVKVNLKKYSHTTTVHQHDMVAALEARGVQYAE